MFVGLLSPRLCSAVLVFLVGLLRVQYPVLAAQPPPKNLILILTDDQRWDTLQYMPTVQSELIQQGVEFTNAFATTPLCCPSRASILTGAYVHHHGVWENFMTDFDDSSTMATWLHDAGYRTSYIWKYLNGYSRYVPYIPPGWDDWHVFKTASYLNYELNENGTLVSYGDTDPDYATDVLAQKAVEFIEGSTPAPFFMVFAPYAPHQPGKPASRHVGLFDGIAPWRPLHFNEMDVSDKPAWVQGLPLLTEDEEALLDLGRQHQIEALQAVDEAVGQIFQALQQSGQLDNTAIIYMTDNGILWGEHRWTGVSSATQFSSKEVPYEEAIRLPFVVRYPGLTGPRQEDQFVLNIDVAPTLLDMAGIQVPVPVDGTSLLPLLMNPTISWRQDFLIEHRPSFIIPDYNGVRAQDWKYIEYATGETELYGLSSDPYEMDNVSGSPDYAGMQALLAERLQELVIAQAPVITTSGVAEGALMTPYSQVLDATGGYPPLVWGLTSWSSPLPNGLSLDSDGVLSGTPTLPGHFTVTVRATDANGMFDDQEIVIQVNDNALNSPPVASFTATPTGGAVPLSVAFDGSGSSDLDGSIVAYDWDFGDGTTSTGMTVSHTYTTVGSYAAVLTVADNDGAFASTSLPVVVEIGMTDLGTLGGSYSFAIHINNPGQVVGRSALASGVLEAFSWTEASGMVGLGTLGLSPSAALGVNDVGEIVGQSRTLSGDYHAFFRTVDGVMLDLGTLGGVVSEARAVNNTGQVVGYSEVFSLDKHAFLWTEGGGMLDLGTLGGLESVAYAINDSGQVTGYSTLASGDPHAFLWTAQTGMVDMGTLAGSSSYGYDVNDLGQAVGRSRSSLAPNPVSWPAGGGIVDLGTLGGVTGGEARGVNLAGEVVGRSATITEDFHAFLWTTEGGMMDLGTLGGVESEARDINDCGQVVGRAETTTGDSRAFLLTRAPVINTVVLPDGQAGMPYNASLSACGGVPPYVWSGTGLPTGMVLDPGGTLSGTPLASGSFSYVVTVVDAVGQSVSATVPLAIQPDVVAITWAVWNSSNQSLLTRATSSAAPTAVLTVVGFADLVYDSVANIYKRAFRNVLSNPGSVTVTSNMGGSATATVP